MPKRLVPSERVWVPGYTKDDGTQVKGYYRSTTPGGGVQSRATPQADRVTQAIRASSRVGKRKG
jgi:hypothetical protein